VAIAGMFAGTVPALAVSTAVDGYRYNLPAGSDKNLDAVRALIKASDAIGFTRRDADATMNCLGCVTPAMRYKGTGTYNGEKADVTMDFDYRFPASGFGSSPAARRTPTSRSRTWRGTSRSQACSPRRRPSLHRTG
jgi:hypothetical protein